MVSSVFLRPSDIPCVSNTPVKHWDNRVIDLQLTEEVNPDNEGDNPLGQSKGLVKFFNNDYGIIIDTEGRDVFAHYKAIYREDGFEGYKALAKGQRVKFHTFKGAKGLYAKKIEVISA